MNVAESGPVDIQAVVKQVRKNVPGLPDADERDWSAEVDRIYTAYSSELWAGFYARCSDSELATDAVQEAFIRLLEQGRHAVRHPVSWLRQVGINWIFDRFRRNATERIVTKDTSMIATFASEPAATLMKAEQIDRIRAALAKMNETDRHVLVLRYALNWPSRKIGLAVNLAPEAIDMRMSRARRALAVILQSGSRQHVISPMWLKNE